MKEIIWTWKSPSIIVDAAAESSLAVLHCELLSQIAGSERKRFTLLKGAQQLTGPSLSPLSTFPG